MKRILVFSLLACSATFAQQQQPPAGRALYYFGFLESPPDRPKWSAEESKAKQAAHLAHINKMADMGKLVAAGPFVDGGKLRGVFVFKGENLEEITALANQDPLVQANALKLTLHPWWGPPDIGEEYKRMQKASGGQMQDSMMRAGTCIVRGDASAWKPGELTKALLATPKVLAAGAFPGGNDPLGVLVVEAQEAEAVKTLVSANPAFASGKLTCEFHPWMFAKGTFSKP